MPGQPKTKCTNARHSSSSTRSPRLASARSAIHMRILSIHPQSSWRMHGLLPPAACGVVPDASPLLRIMVNRRVWTEWMPAGQRHADCHQPGRDGIGQLRGCWKTALEALSSKRVWVCTVREAPDIVFGHPLRDDAGLIAARFNPQNTVVRWRICRPQQDERQKRKDPGRDAPFIRLAFRPSTTVGILSVADDIAVGVWPAKFRYACVNDATHQRTGARFFISHRQS